MWHTLRQPWSIQLRTVLVPAPTGIRWPHTYGTDVGIFGRDVPVAVEHYYALDIYNVCVRLLTLDTRLDAATFRNAFAAFLPRRC